RPEETVAAIKEVAQSGLRNIIGECCGTTPDHIKAIRKAVNGLPPRRITKDDDLNTTLYLSGLEPVKLPPASLFSNIGERCNVAGSRIFLRLITSGKFHQALEVAKKQVEMGAQVLDINMDEGMLDSAGVMNKFV